ncbi:cell wall anchor protein [Micromonospora soli]|uniref:cell wall anchor protein n=1 Tax=Micromonospora sp. NBRC 110009 TaxID=3061627 RepID=UPI002671C7E0|nr:cell wall anchor protein [Micromonospora sp. NBRC 110009]WKU00675.1 cell wall anchor protein [Micromonospora sp. NBRC 110009]
MIFRNRPLVRLGAAALLASGALTVFGAPAHAAGTETDLSLDVVGTKVADGAIGKLAYAKVTNNGENTPSELAVRIDVSKVDFTRFAVFPDADCKPDSDGENPGAFTCYANQEALPGPGETIDLPMVVLKAEETLDKAYSIPVTVTLISKDDTTEDNNTKNATVEFSKESGPDLAVLADDVKNAVTVKNGKIQLAGDLHAGDTAQLIYTVWNQGDVTTAGFKVSVKLPAGVTFTETEDECEYATDKASLVCTYPNLPFIPLTQEPKNDDETPGGAFYHLLSVSKDVKAGALTGGTVEVTPLLPAPGLKAQSTEIKNAPDNMTPVDAPDVDGSDNTDGYAVVVAAEGGAGGGGGGGGGGGEVGNDDGGLPVTGAKAGLIGGIGVAVLVAGGAMFLVARRRRVVLVTPGDEKPTA